MNNNLDYNSTREKLIMPEYGRTIQDMVRYALTIEDRSERTRCAKTIVNIMSNMFPQQKDVADYKHKIWDHLAIISEFKLDVDSPYPMPERERLERRPDVVPYDNHRIRLKHYGHIIEDMIEKAVEAEDPVYKRKLVEAIANYMKNSLLAWNKDFATDERLFNDIRMLSGGRLEINEGDGIKTAAYHRDNLMHAQPNRNYKRNNGRKNNKQNGKQNNKNNRRNNNRRGSY